MEEKTSPWNAALVIVALVALMIFAIVNAIDEYRLINSLAERPFFIRLSPPAIPILLLLPSFAIICFGIYKRTRNPDKIVNINNNIRFLAISFIAFIITCFVFASKERQWLREIGYSVCPWYSASTIGARKVWVSNPIFCTKDATLVRLELFEWLEDAHRKGFTPTLGDVTTTVDTLESARTKP